MSDQDALTELEKLAFDGTVKRQQSLLDLMRHTDSRAQQFIVAYSGLMGAALLFAVKEFTGPVEPRYAAVGFVVTYALSVFFATYFAFQACRHNQIGLASRGADFWEWALANSNAKDALAHFLSNSEKQMRENEDIQKRAARMLKHSMSCGMVALVIAGVGALTLVARSIV